MADDRFIDKLMGHVTEDMRRRYQHLSKRNLAESVELLDYTTSEVEELRDTIDLLDMKGA